MGDFSIVCAVTGLPITRRQKIVGFELEPYGFVNDSCTPKHYFVPASWPVVGEYNYSGGFEDHVYNSKYAFIHYDVWLNAQKYWHYLNDRTRKNNWFVTDGILEKAKKAKEIGEMFVSSDLEKSWSDTDYIYYTLMHNHTYGNVRSDYWLVFRNLFDGIDITNHSEGACVLSRNKFAEIICQKILDGTWSKEDFLTIHRLTCFYSGEKLLGKPIRPSRDLYIEQYPTYTQRKKLLNFHLELIEKLKKRR